MKRITFLSLFVIVLSATLSAQSKEEEAVSKVSEELRLAMISADKAKLENLVTDQLSYGHSGGHIDDKKEFVEKIVSGKSDFVTIDITGQTILVSGKTAIVRHILKAQTNDSGKPGEVQLRVMLVWQKLKGGWKLLARQAVKITT